MENRKLPLIRGSFYWNKLIIFLIIKYSKFGIQRHLMKRYLKWLLIFTVAVIVLLIMPTFLPAQIDPSGDPDAPIDGGLGVLIAIGIGYGLNKIHTERKQKDHPL